MTSKELLKFAAELLDSKKATDLVAIDISEITSLADYFLIASGSSTIQVKALSGELEDRLSAHGVEPRRVEGESSAMWVLLDYGDVIIHIFNHETRDFYCLERLYADAPKIPLDFPKKQGG